MSTAGLVHVPAGQGLVLKAYLSKRAYSKSPEFEAREFFGVAPDAPLDDLTGIAGAGPEVTPGDCLRPWSRSATRRSVGEESNRA